MTKPKRSPARHPVTTSAAVTSPNLPTVFIHSGFRTSSTWLWKHFREKPAFCAYYEVFHEAMGGLSMDTARSVQSDQWRSRHPTSAPYFLEFIPLLNRSGGVRDFTDEPALAANFVPMGGLDGDLPSGEARYVASLIKNAHEAGRIPVLTCTRTLGRSAALKRKFGGVHILLHRNLFHQWNSFSGQHRTGNLYFLDYLFQIIFRSKDDAFMDLLKTFAPTGMETNFQAALEGRYDDAFAIFVSWHVYMTIHAARSADVVIDVTRLAAKPEYRVEVQDQIRTVTGQSLNLGDVAAHVDAPWRPIRDLATTQLTVRLLVDRAYVTLGATPEERELGEAMLVATWEEQRVHATYTQAYFEAAEAAFHSVLENKNRLGRAAQSTALGHASETIDVEIAAEDISSGPTFDELDALRFELVQARQELSDQQAIFTEAARSQTALSDLALADQRAMLQATAEAAAAQYKSDQDEQTAFTVTSDIEKLALALAAAQTTADQTIADSEAKAEALLAETSASYEIGLTEQAEELALKTDALFRAEASLVRARDEALSLVGEQQRTVGENERLNAALEQSRVDAVNLTAANARLLQDLQVSREHADQVSANQEAQMHHHAGEMDVLVQGLAAARADIDTLTAEIGRRDTELATLRDLGAQELDLARTAAQKASEDLSREIESRLDAMAREEELAQTLAIARSEAETAARRQQEAEAQIEASRKLLEEVIEQGNIANKALKRDLDAALVALDAQRAAASAEAENAQAARDIAVSELQGELRAAHVANEQALENTACALKVQVEVAEGLKGELELARLQIGELSTELARARAYATRAEAGNRLELRRLSDEIAAVEEASSSERQALERSLGYEQTARETAMAQAVDAQRALAYLEVAYQSGMEQAEQTLATLTQTQDKLATAQAEAARLQALADLRHDELVEAARVQDQAETERQQLRSALDHMEKEVQRVHDEAAAQSQVLNRSVEAAMQREDDLKRRLNEAQKLVVEQNGVAAEREATLMAALETESWRHQVLLTERDDARRTVGERQAELDSIKEGVTWRAASTLRRLGVG